MGFPECGTSPSATVHIRQALAEDLFIWRQQRDARGSSRDASVPRLLAGKNFPGREIGSENSRRMPRKRAPRRHSVVARALLAANRRKKRLVDLKEPST